IKFLKMAEGTQMDEPQGTIADINTEFDTATPFTIPRIKKADGTFALKVDGYTYEKAHISYMDYDGNTTEVDIENATSDIVVQNQSSEYYNLKIKNIDDGDTIYVTPVWTEHKYSIEYNAHVPSGKTLKKGELITTKSDILFTEDVVLDMPDSDRLAIEGYKFIGWGTKSNAGKNDVEYKAEIDYQLSRLASKKEGVPNATNDNEIYRLYAVWIKNPYYVNYDIDNDYSATPSLATQMFETDSDEDAYITKIPFKIPGYTFLYWNDAANRNKDIGWKATYSDGEKIPAGKNIRNDSDGDTEADFVAVWKEHKYVIDFDYNVPTSPLAGARNYVFGTKKLEPALYYDDIDLGEAVVTIPGYEFDYWTDPKGNKYYEDGSVISLAGKDIDGEHITLTYHWKKAPVIIQLYHNDEDENESTFDTYFDATYSVIRNLPTPTAPGFTFVEWTTVKATPYETVAADKVVKNTDIVRRATPVSAREDYVQVLYGHWKHNDLKLTFDAGKTTGIAGLEQAGKMSNNKSTDSILVRYGRPLGEKGVKGSLTALDTPTLPGYTFVGFLNSEGDYIKKETPYWTSVDETVVAEWEPNKYNVAFSKGANSDVEGTLATVSGVVFDDSGEYFTEVVETQTSRTFKRKGYTFDYWQRQGSEDLKNKNSQRVVKATYSNGEEIVNLTEIANNTVIMVANWKEHSYEVAFDGNAPTNSAGFVNTVVGSMDNQKFKYTERKALSKNKFKVDGYKFIGWASKSNATRPDYLDEGLVSKLAGSDYGVDGESDVFTLYAVWEANTYYIKFNLNDKRENAWGSTDAAFENGSGKTFDRTKYEYAIKFDSEFGNAVGNAESSSIKGKDRIGYDFLGWVSTLSVANPKALRRSERASSVIRSTDIFRATSNIILYALWDNQTFKVTYNTNTRNYSSDADRPHLERNEDTIYFDCAFTSDGELNGKDGTLRSLPSVTGGQYAFKGWYYDQTFYLDSDGVTIKDTGSPSTATKVDYDTVFDKTIYDYDNLVKDKNTTNQNLQLNA
ncbi:MAG: InlB B-repeat-containing protein, partial [Lachnospiraceae bacterium]|nr:InlB B-repeat-containing protein [Lachnospiraceae bacterium]